MIGSLATHLAYERACVREMRISLHEQLRRKAQETTRKEETMPTLLEDLEALWNCSGNTASLALAEGYVRLRTFIEANTPWLPPQQDGFGPWIEYRVGDPGPRVTDVTHVLLSDERNSRQFNSKSPLAARFWTWGPQVVAYCVKLEDGK